MRVIERLLLITGLIVGLSGCSSYSPKQADSAHTTDLRALQSLDKNKLQTSDIGNIRYNALRDTALSIGARGGLAARATKINKILEPHARTLDRIYNFNALMLEDNIVPPVLIEGRNNLSVQKDAVNALLLTREQNPGVFVATLEALGMDSTQIQYLVMTPIELFEDAVYKLNLEEKLNLNSIRVADRSFQILVQAHFATTVPNWRHYLFLPHKTPEAPDTSLLPKTSAERKVWRYYIQEGWLAGIDQANLIYSESQGRLKRDYIGMVRYLTLLSQNMVSKPYVAKVDLGITGSGADMSINERVLRITALPELKLDGSHWRTDAIQISEVRHGAS